jgi:hypothetical protein
MNRNMAEMKTKAEEPTENIDKLLDDSAAIMQRWKKVAAEITADSIGIGHEIVPKVYAAAQGFQGIQEALAGYGHLNEEKERIFF